MDQMIFNTKFVLTLRILPDKLLRKKSFWESFEFFVCETTGVHGKQRCCQHSQAKCALMFGTTLSHHVASFDCLAEELQCICSICSIFFVMVSGRCRSVQLACWNYKWRQRAPRDMSLSTTSQKGQPFSSAHQRTTHEDFDSDWLWQWQSIAPDLIQSQVPIMGRGQCATTILRGNHNAN